MSATMDLSEASYSDAFVEASLEYGPQVSICLQKQLRRFLEDGRDPGETDDDDYFVYHNHTAVDTDYGVIDDYFSGSADPYEPTYYLIRNGLLAFLCVCIAAIMAGLLMGIMSLDPLFLEIRAKTAKTTRERREASTLIGFVKRKNLMLVSIIIINMGVNEALPLFLDRLVPTYISVLLSTTLVVLVGEILPSAYLTGPNQIPLAYRLLPILRATIFLTFPISYPLSRLLDEHMDKNPVSKEKSSETVPAFRRSEVSAYVKIKHEQIRKAKHNIDDTESLPDMLMPEGAGLCGVLDPVCTTIECGMNESESPIHHESDNVDDDDVENIERILSFREKMAVDHCIPLQRVFAIESRTKMTEETVMNIFYQGYSRVPVMDELQVVEPQSRPDTPVPGNILGIMMTRQLMVIDKSTGRAASTLPLFRPPCIKPDTTMTRLLAIFRAGKGRDSQMALVCERPDVANAALDQGAAIPTQAAGVIGIITFDDVLQGIVGDIHDEKDRRSRAPFERAQWVIGKWKCFALQKRLDREAANNNNGAPTPFGYRAMVASNSNNGVPTPFGYRAMVDAPTPDAPKKLPEIS